MGPVRKFAVFAVALIFVLSLSIKPSQAQKEYSLSECIERAQLENISVKRQGLIADAAKSNLLAARAKYLPSFNAWASHNLNSGKTINVEDYSYINTQYQDGNLGLRGALPLFNGLANFNTVKQQKISLLAAVKETEKMKNSLAIQVTIAYLQVLFAEELLKVAVDQGVLSASQVESTKVFVETGKMAQANLLEMKSLAAQDLLAQTRAQSQLSTAILQLGHLMNLENPDQLRILHPADIEIVKSTLPDSETIFTLAETNLPRIAGARLRVDAAASELAVSRSLLIPDISLDGVYYSRYSELGFNPMNPNDEYAYMQQVKDNSYKRIAININIPLLNQLQSRNQITQAKIGTLDAKYALDLEKENLRKEIEQAYSDAANGWAAYKAAEDALQFATESFSYTKAQFESGLATSIDFNISRTQMTRIQSELIQAKYEFLLRRKILDFYAGEEIRL